MSLFDQPAESKDKKIDAVMDKIKEKYGYDSISHGGSLKEMSSKKFK